MLRLQAVRSLLVEEVASLRIEGEPSDARPDERLDTARKKALAFVVLCWTALLVLILTRVPGDPALLEGFGSLYLAGLLIVATAAGFRLGQWEKYRAVQKALADLEERTGD
ncbi:MAG: hypothetical protein R3234_03755 [Thermoanaerobaculia bacterium]|nr:hypothetical protein [Thermoanaerobaculia bacterium]